MRRIIFVNLHSNWMLVKNSAVLLFKNSAAVKHKYLLDYLLAHPDEYEVCNFINDRGFSIFTHGSDLLQKFLNLFARLENWLILKKNGIAPSSVKVIRDASEIRKDDIVITYNLILNNYRMLDKVNAFKVSSLIHYGGRKEQYSLIENAGIDCLMCEVNLEHTSELYRRFCHLSLPWVVHPFVFQERFKPLKPFAERQNKAFSVGTITYKYEPEFLEVYGDPCDQPIRKIVKDNPEYFADTVDCYSEDYLENEVSKQISDSDNVLTRFYKRVYNRFHSGRQKKYFSFDMVEKFNDYKMHIVGEEILGVPGIGYVEGMACGSAYIGLDSQMYREHGLVPGVHYIAYDGTKEGLRAVVEHYQKPENQAELERIAAAGCDYVRTHFTGPVVAENIIESIVKEFKVKNQEPT